MESKESFFGYTFPESLLFGAYTRKTAEYFWKNALDTGLKKVKGFLKLQARYSAHRLEKACERACFYGQPSIGNIVMILEQGLDRLPLHPTADIKGQYRFEFM